MDMRTTDTAWETALKAVQHGFYSGDLPGAVSAGQTFLAEIGTASCAPGEQAMRARVLLWLVRCARRADEQDTALARVYTGIAAARAAGDNVLECLLQAQYVHVLANLGQNETALSEGYKLLRRVADSGTTQTQAACWLALGHVHWTMQQWRDGGQAYNRAMTLADSCGDKEVCGLAKNGVAVMEDHYAIEARAAGRADDAQAHARRAFALFEAFTRTSQDIGDSYNAWMGKYNQAYCLFSMGEHQAARDLLNIQLALLDGDRGSRRQLIVQVLGDIHLAEGRHDLAIANQTEALDIAERLQLPLLALDACGSLVNALEGSGDHRAALVQHRRYHAFYVQLASNKAQAHARAMAVMYDTEKAQALADAQRKRADQLETDNSSLTQEKAVLERRSMEDALTGLANRRCFDQAMGLALHEAAGADSAAPGRALAMIDVDHFKRVNDRFSHMVGDEVLRRLGALLQRCCRKQDLPARFGGEEFAVILSEVDRPTARAACERLRAAVEAEPWSEVHTELAVTVSIGLVHVDEAAADATPISLLEVADARLYIAKRGGRNQVVDVSTDPSVGSQMPA